MEIDEIISGLETIVADEKMWRKMDWYATICKEALSVLKDREPVKPKYHGGEFWCGCCGFFVDNYFGNKYCQYCGRKVKWND